LTLPIAFRRRRMGMEIDLPPTCADPLPLRHLSAPILISQR
jgi:hypothetical protein